MPAPVANTITLFVSWVALLLMSHLNVPWRLAQTWLLLGVGGQVEGIVPQFESKVTPWVEEMATHKRSLASLVQEISDIIVRRAKKGIHHGVILVPEDLLEFLPEFAFLLEELNAFRKQRTLPTDIESLCTERSQQTLRGLPKRIREQLLSDRDPDGNLRVSRISTERLLINLVTKELARRKKEYRYHGQFQGMAHYFGYEGRCGLPSNFDCHYGTAMGKTASVLLHHRQTGVMATCSHLHLPVEQWQPLAMPFLQLMSIQRVDGVERPYIK